MYLCEVKASDWGYNCGKLGRKRLTEEEWEVILGRGHGISERLGRDSERGDVFNDLQEASRPRRVATTMVSGYGLWPYERWW